MRTLKKALALVIVLSMALGTVGGATFTDVPSTNPNSQAINMLADLGVLVGQGNGTYAPNSTITRAEACAVIYRMMSGKTAASNFTGPTKFSDVASDFWGSGYVNYCTELGIVEGYPDGTFLPDKAISYAEMTTMLVRALGLDKDANGISLNLSYPVGYIAVADLQGVNDDVDLTADEPADRGTVAQMTYNAILNADYVRGGLVNEAYQTIGEYVLKLDSVEGIVVATGDYDYTTTCDDHYFQLWVDEDDDNAIDASEITSYKYDVTADQLYNAVKVWKKEGSSKIYAVVTTSDTNIVTLNSADLTAVEGSTDVYSYDNNGTTTKLNLADAAIFVNYAHTGTLSAVEALLENRYAAQITFVSNDGTNKSVEAIFVKAYEYAKIDAIESDAISLKSQDAGISNNIFTAYASLDREDSTCTIPSGLASGDKVIVYKDAMTGDSTVLKTTSASGKLTKVSGSTYTVGGTGYKFTSNITPDYSIGDSYKLVISPIFGYLVQNFSAVSASVDDYYLVTKTGNKDDIYGGSATHYATAYDTKGVEHEFTVDSAATALVSSSARATYNTVCKLTLNAAKTKVTAAEVVIAQDSTAESYMELGSYNSTTKLLVAGSSYVQIVDDSVIFFKHNDDVWAYVGTMAKAKGLSANIKSDSDTYNPVVAMIVDGAPMGSVSADTDVNGLILSASYELDATDSDKGFATIKMAAQGAIKTYTTETDDISTIEDIYTLANNKPSDTHPTYAKGTIVEFDLTSDGKIAIDSDGVAFRQQSGSTDGKWDNTLTDVSVNTKINDRSTDNMIVDLDIGIYEVASDVNVYIIDKGDLGAAKTGTFSSVIPSSGLVDRTVQVVYDSDNEVITAIYFYDDSYPID